MPELDTFTHLHRVGKSRSQILAAMKRRGLTIVEAIRASMLVFEIELKEAKSLVAADPSWLPMARAAEPFQQELIQSFLELEGVDPGVLTPRQHVRPKSILPV